MKKWSCIFGGELMSKTKRKKTFFDYQNDKNYAQDVTTGEFIHLKTGKRVKFRIGLKTNE